MNVREDSFQRRPSGAWAFSVPVAHKSLFADVLGNQLGVAVLTFESLVGADLSARRC